jgi:thioredoxin reductase
MARTLGVETLLLDDHGSTREPAIVWGIWGPTLAFNRAGGSELVEARAIIVATGSRARTAIFPGWTLEGVMTAERAGRPGVTRGGRVIVAGSGSELIASAARLDGDGVDVAAIVEAAPAPRLRARDRAWLQGRDIPYLVGSAVVRAEGDVRVTAVVVSGIDRDWRPVAGTEVRHDADALVVGIGREAASELTRLAGCDHAYGEEAGYIPTRDDWLRTTAPGILAAGDCAGVGSERSARLEGRLAAVTVAMDLDVLSADEAVGPAARIRRALRRSRLVESRYARACPIGVGVYERSEPDTIVCRCESVTCEQIEGAIADGVTDLNVVKVRTRAGAGVCQARRCGRQLTWLVAQRTGTPMTEVEPLTVRPPVHPVPIGALVREG